MVGPAQLTQQRLPLVRWQEGGAHRVEVSPENEIGNNTVCPGSSDPFYIVSYYIKSVTTSWTQSTLRHLI